MNSNGIITGTVSQLDVQQVLGVSIPAEQDAWSYLCGNKHGKINKWAKYKPVTHSNIFASNDASVIDWWKGDLKDCNLEITAVSGNIATYGYKNVGSNFRIIDFNGYNHSAVHGLKFKLSGFSFDLIKQENQTLTISAEDDESLITIYDLKDAPFMTGRNLIVTILGTSQMGSVEKSYITNITGRAISVTVPFADLVALGSGKFTVSMNRRQIASPYAESPLFPESNYYLTITNDIGIVVTDSGDNRWHKVYNPATSAIASLTSFPIYLSSYLNISGGYGFYMGGVVIKNGASFALTSSNFFLTFEVGSSSVVRRCNIFVMGSATAGGTSLNLNAGVEDMRYIGVPHANLPMMSSSGSPISVNVYMEVYDSTRGTYFRVTDVISMRILKTDGNAL